jgi:hypothetical protein
MPGDAAISESRVADKLKPQAGKCSSFVKLLVMADAYASVSEGGTKIIACGGCGTDP